VVLRSEVTIFSKKGAAEVVLKHPTCSAARQVVGGEIRSNLGRLCIKTSGPYHQGERRRDTCSDLGMIGLYKLDVVQREVYVCPSRHPVHEVALATSQAS
jgi:hypothetical protein